MMSRGYFENAVLMCEMINLKLFEDTSFYYDEEQELSSKIKTAPLMTQGHFLKFKNKLFSFI